MFVLLLTERGDYLLITAFVGIESSFFMILFAGLVTSPVVMNDSSSGLQIQ